MTALEKPQLPNISDTDITNAAGFILAGDVVGIPTETVYGVAADGTNEYAIERLYAVKRRQPTIPLQVLDNSVEAAMMNGHFHGYARTLAEEFWPGPLTIIVYRHEGCKVHVSASAHNDTIGIRVPQNQTLRRLVSAVGRPLVASSANRAGGTAPDNAQDVIAELGDELACVLDAGDCALGQASTVIDCTAATPKILREGSITREDIERVLAISL